MYESPGLKGKTIKQVLTMSIKRKSRRERKRNKIMRKGLKRKQEDAGWVKREL